MTCFGEEETGTDFWYCGEGGSTRLGGFREEQWSLEILSGFEEVYVVMLWNNEREPICGKETKPYKMWGSSVGRRLDGEPGKEQSQE
jgi:hypothetical protein